MTGDIRDYARLGLVHHLLYPACTTDPDDHVRTLSAFIMRSDIETFDCCLPYGDHRRAELIPRIQSCGKTDIAYAAHLFPFRKLAPTTCNPSEQAQVRMIFDDMLEQAAAIGATGFVVASGVPSPEASEPRHHEAFLEFCKWFCSRLAAHKITALLEPFDMTIDKKFLYGSTRDCVDLVQAVRQEHANMAIELDVAHLPLMGEEFETAIRTTAPCLQRIHLGNCVLKDTRHPWYGDTHPPMGFDAGEIDVPELATILRTLLDIGFLDKNNRGALVLEMQPFPGKTPEQTIDDSFARVEQAWKKL